MGYIAHDAVIATVYVGDRPDIDSFRASLPKRWRGLVVGPIESVANDHPTYMFAPDGSKEGWGDSDEGDRYRAQFEALFDGSYTDVVRVRFGGDHVGAEVWESRLADGDANEERQREGQMEDAWQSRDWESVRRLQDEERQREAANEAEVKRQLREALGVGRWSGWVRQREDEADPLEEDDWRDRMDGNGLRLKRKSSGYWVWAGVEEVDGWTLDDIHRHQGPLTFAPEAEPDPLDEDDHRDRVDRDGRIVRRKGRECWAWPEFPGFHDDDAGWSLSSIVRSDGPLTFAPDTTPQATGDDLTASGAESGPVEGSDADDTPEAIVCPECWHGIDWHDAVCGVSYCDCQLSPSDIARVLIAEAVAEAVERREGR